MSTSNSSTFLTRAYELTGPNDAQQLYDDWAASYDKEMSLEGYGYKSPLLVAQEVQKHSNGNLDGSIFDAGCGTGLAGVELRKLGVKAVIDGNDISPKMLEYATRTGAYRDLECEDLSKPIHKEDSTYDIVVCAGVLTHGHVGPVPALREFVRITKKGGIIITTIMDALWAKGGYETEVKQLASAEKLVEVVSTERVHYEKTAAGKILMLVLRKV